MLRLTIAAEGASVRVPQPGAPRVHVERDGGGTACALFQTVRDEHWIHLPELASFRFSPLAEEVTAFAQPAARPDQVRAAFDEYVLPMAMQARGVEVLHASAVAGPRGVFAFCAEAGTGKSTLAFGLAGRGWAHWADDWLTLERDRAGVWGLQHAFAVKLRAASAAHYGFGSADTVLPGRNAGELCRAPLAGVCILARAAVPAGCELAQDAGVALERLAPADALRGLLAHGCWFSPVEPERKRRMLEFYLHVAASLPVWRVRFTPGLDRLSGLLDRLERLLSEPCSAEEAP